MRTLIYRYGSICEPDIIDTFKEYGFEIIELTPEMTDKQFSQEAGIKLVSDTLLQTPCDFVFSINFYPFLAEVCNIMKLRYLCLIVDSPVLELYSSSVTHPWNRIFIFDKMLFSEIAPRNPECVFYLPLAVNVQAKQDAVKTLQGMPASMMHEMRDTKNAASTNYTAQISFVGSLYSEKCPYDHFHDASEFLDGYIGGLMEAQLQVYGYYFLEELLTEEIVEEFKKHTDHFLTLPYSSKELDRVITSQYYIASRITSMERQRMLQALSEQFEVKLYTGSDTSMLPKVQNCGRVKTQTQMPLVFAQSKINLNMTAKSIRSGIPLRVWDILGCGGFCISNYQPEIAECFTIGEEIETYGSKEELLEKTAYYLSHEKRRQEIAQAGFEKVQKDHTFLVRLAQMMEMAFNR